MFKLAVIFALVAAALASGIPAVPVVSEVVSPVITPVISSQRAIINHVPRYGYGLGTSARFFDKTDYGYGLRSYGVGVGGIRAFAPSYYGGNVFDGINSIGLAYNNYGLNDGRVLGLGLGRLGYGFGRYGYGLGGYGLP